MNPQEHLSYCRLCGVEPRAVHHGTERNGMWVIDCPNGCFKMPFSASMFNRAADLWNYNQRETVARFMEPGEVPSPNPPPTPKVFKPCRICGKQPLQKVLLAVGKVYSLSCCSVEVESRSALEVWWKWNTKQIEGVI